MPMLDTPHRRYNVLTGEWTLVSSHRAKRPWLGQVEKLSPEILTAHDPTCYLCPRNERAGGIFNPDYTGTYAFENDFAALLPNSVDEDTSTALSASPAPSHPLLVSAPEQGHCLVVCFSPRHDLTLPELDLPAIEKVLSTWAQRSSDMATENYIHYVQVFENKGAMMGCSNPHPHSQIWAQSQLPNEIVKESSTQTEYFKRIAARF